MTTKLQIFYKQLEKTVVPQFQAEGFEFDKKKTFRKSIQLENLTFVQIIEFQIGIKRWSGFFTVNLGVYVDAYRPSDWDMPDDKSFCTNCLPDMNIRLGHLFIPPQSIFQKIFCIQAECGDYWWQQKDKEIQMDKVFNEVTDTILGQGLDWMNERSTIARVEEARNSLDLRRQNVENNKIKDWDEFAKQNCDDPELTHIWALWLKLSAARYEVEEGNSLMARLKLKAWETDDPLISEAWANLTAPENLEDLEYWSNQNKGELNPSVKEWIDKSIEDCKKRTRK